MAREMRLLWTSLIITVLVVWIVVLSIVPRHETSGVPTRVRLTALGGECVECHTRITPGIVEQHARSGHAIAGVTCRDCHEVATDHFGATEHYGVTISPKLTSAQCAPCHSAEVNQFLRSRHGLPAYVAMTGVDSLSDEHRAIYERIEERASVDPIRNSLYHAEGPRITRFACQGCHEVGKPFPDGSVGDCTACHLRHEYSLEQARKPETCGACHIGPDHPQWEIYQESPHGIAYQTMGHTWNWDAEPGTLTVSDMPAATCATCHISGFGTQGTTHDVGERLTWYLFQEVSQRRPGWQENASRMQQVCAECHSPQFVTDFYTDADDLVAAVNEWATEGKDMYQDLIELGLVTATPWDEPIDFVAFDLWHHWGRTAKFGAWMQGPDYTQWHGAYEMLRELVELRTQSRELKEEAGIEIQEEQPPDETPAGG